MEINKQKPSAGSLRGLSKSRFVLAGVALLMGGLSTAWADAWPTKPIQLVVAFPPGGSADQMARLLAPQLSQKLGQSVVVENRSGASGMIGTGFVAKGDDHTFGLVFDTHVTNAKLMKDTIPFDTMKDITYVTLLGTAPMAIFTGSKSDYKSFSQLVDASKKGAHVSYATVGTAGLSHLALASLSKKGGFDWQQVAYRGGGPIHIDVAANHIPLGISSVLAIKGLVDGGTLVPLAVTSRTRSAIFPNVPTVAESGFEGFEASTWWGIIGSEKMSDSIAQKMHEALAEALNTPATADKLKSQGVEIVAAGPQEFRSFVQKEISIWGKVIDENNIKLDK
ncbi:MAG TPA: tripartite tricarboxylate transporter substrate-binding protein [Eoetvoesiella sp.]